MVYLYLWLITRVMINPMTAPNSSFLTLPQPLQRSLRLYMMYVVEPGKDFLLVSYPGVVTREPAERTHQRKKELKLRPVSNFQLQHMVDSFCYSKILILWGFGAYIEAYTQLLYSCMLLFCRQRPRKSSSVQLMQGIYDIPHNNANSVIGAVTPHNFAGEKICHSCSVWICNPTLLCSAMHELLRF